MAIRQLRFFDDEILRKKCREVETVDDKIRLLLKDMADTMYHAGNGAGLAAPQVGILKRLVVIDVGNGLMKLVNPRITSSGGTQQCNEGCLSFPGKWGRTVRPQWVTVEALNERGEQIRVKGKGLLAQCLCHEIDHLDGVVLPDRVIEWLVP